jgi:urease accessory protein
MPINLLPQPLLHLLQLTSPSLPVGAYSYSEGLETLVHQGIIADSASLQQWLTQELEYGAIRLEVAVLVRICQATRDRDWKAVNYWNQWLSAARETEELRQQSWQMGQSLMRLLLQLQPDFASFFSETGTSCNFAISFGIAAACWQIDTQAAALGYLHSWASNLVTAGVKLIPLGQTQGQQVLFALYPTLEQAAVESLKLENEELSSCSWGLALASMNHETLYARLFRS